MKHHYLIDYENVHEDGLTGLNTIEDDAVIHIFYSDRARKLDLDSFREGQILQIEALKVPVGKQSLDMQLVSYMGYLMGREKGEGNCYIIVSKDNGYLNSIPFWRQIMRDGTTVEVRPQIRPTASAAADVKSVSPEAKESSTGNSQRIPKQSRSLNSRGRGRGRVRREKNQDLSAEAVQTAEISAMKELPAETVPARPVQVAEIPAVKELPAETVPAETVQAAEIPALKEIPAETIPAETVQTAEIPTVKDTSAETVPVKPVQAAEIPTVKDTPAETVPAKPVQAAEIPALKDTPAETAPAENVQTAEIPAVKDTPAETAPAENVQTAEIQTVKNRSVRPAQTAEVPAVKDHPSEPDQTAEVRMVKEVPADAVPAANVSAVKDVPAEDLPAVEGSAAKQIPVEDTQPMKVSDSAELSSDAASVGQTVSEPAKPRTSGKRKSASRKPGKPMDRSALNTAVMQTLSRSNVDAATTGKISSIVMKHAQEEQNKTKIYREIIRALGQKEGLTVYNYIKSGL